MDGKQKIYENDTLSLGFLLFGSIVFIIIDFFDKNTGMIPLIFSVIFLSIGIIVGIFILFIEKKKYKK